MSTKRKRTAKAAATTVIMADMSPQATPLPSIDEYDLSGMFAQSMDDTLRLDDRNTSDENNASLTLSNSFAGFGSITGKLESFNANKKTLSTVPSDSGRAIVPSGGHSSIVPVDTGLDEGHLTSFQDVIGVARKILIETNGSERIGNKFDIIFDKFNYFIFSQKVIIPPVFHEALCSFAIALVEARIEWGIVQVPAAFGAIGHVIVRRATGTGELEAYVAGLQVKSGNLVDDLTKFGVDFHPVLPHESIKQSAESESSEEESESAPATAVVIRGTVDVFGFFDYLRSSEFGIGDEGRRPPTIIASSAFRHAVYVSPSISVKTGTDRTRFVQIEKLIVPIELIDDVVRSSGGGGGGSCSCSVSVDVGSFKQLNSRHRLNRSNLLLGRF